MIKKFQQFEATKPLGNFYQTLLDVMSGKIEPESMKQFFNLKKGKYTNVVYENDKVTFDSTYDYISELLCDNENALSDLDNMLDTTDYYYDRDYDDELNYINRAINDDERLVKMFEGMTEYTGIDIDLDKDGNEDGGQGLKQLLDVMCLDDFGDAYVNNVDSDKDECLKLKLDKLITSVSPLQFDRNYEGNFDGEFTIEYEKLQPLLDNIIKNEILKFTDIIEVIGKNYPYGDDDISHEVEYYMTPEMIKSTKDFLVTELGKYWDQSKKNPTESHMTKLLTEQPYKLIEFYNTSVIKDNFDKIDWKMKYNDKYLFEYAPPDSRICDWFITDEFMNMLPKELFEAWDNWKVNIYMKRLGIID